VGAIVDPFPRRGDPFAGGNYRCVTDNRHEITASAGLRSQNAEAVLRVTGGDALDKARKHFLG